MAGNFDGDNWFETRGEAVAAAASSFTQDWLEIYPDEIGPKVVWRYKPATSESRPISMVRSIFAGK